MKVIVKVRLKPGILDPQGQAVHHALQHLGYDMIRQVYVGKLIEMELEDHLSEEKAKELATDMARRLLANPVMEVFEVEIQNQGVLS